MILLLLYFSTPLHLYYSFTSHTSTPLHLYTSTPLHLYTSTPLQLLTLVHAVQCPHMSCRSRRCWFCLDSVGCFVALLSLSLHCCFLSLLFSFISVFIHCCVYRTCWTSLQLSIPSNTNTSKTKAKARTVNPMTELSRWT